LSGSDTLAHYQQVLDSVTFNSTSANPTNYGTDFSRTLSWQVNDGTLNSSVVTSNVTVAGVDQAPVLSGAGNIVTFTQGGGAVTAAGTLAVGDVDSLKLASASVTISSGFFTGDTLSAVTMGTTITASYSAATGVLTLSGGDTVAHYQTVFRSVRFSSTSLNPTNYGADLSRTLSWQVNDGTLASNTVTSTVKVVGVDQAPVLAGAGNTVTFTQGGAAVTASPGVTVTSVDKLNLASASVIISTGFLAGDTLSAVTTGTGITATYNAGIGLLILSGIDTLAHYQQVLDSVSYSSTSANPTNFGADVSRTVSWQVNDGTMGSNTVTSKVTVVGVDQAPVLGGAGNTAAYTQGGLGVIASPGLTVAHVDGTTLASATVTISSGLFTGDVLAAVTTGTGITAKYTAATGVLSLTGKSSLAHYQQVLDTITFSSTSANPTNGGTDTSRTLTWVANDGTLSSNTVTSTVTVATLAPAVATPALAGSGLGRASIAMVHAATTAAAAPAPAVAASGIAPANAATARTAAAASPAPAPAAQPKSPALANTSISMGSLTAAAGSIVTVPVNISSARGLQSMHLVVRYDAGALTPLSVERSALTDGFTYTAKIVKPGLLRIDAAGTRPLRLGSGELFGMKFALAPTAAGTLRIDFESASLNDARLSVRDPNVGAIIVKAKNTQLAAAPAGVKPAINLDQPARSFEIGAAKTHAWLDDFFKPGAGTNGKTNSWTVVVKPKILH